MVWRARLSPGTGQLRHKGGGACLVGRGLGWREHGTEPVRGGSGCTARRGEQRGWTCKQRAGRLRTR